MRAWAVLLLVTITLLSPLHQSYATAGDDHSQSDLCTVSASEELPWLGFPLSVYDLAGLAGEGQTSSQPQQIQSQSKPQPQTQHYKCAAYESKELNSHTELKTYADRMVDYTCPAPQTARCPVTPAHHTHFGLTAGSLPAPNSTFCAWVSAVLQSELAPRSACADGGAPRSQPQSQPQPVAQSQTVVNVVVLGGSVTMGFGAHGCCCTEDDKCTRVAAYNQTCSEDYTYSRSIAAPRLTVPTPTYLVPTSYSCAWSGRLVRWLNREFGGPGTNTVFRLKNLGEGSANSQHTSNVLHKQLKQANLTLGPDDLVFLDHSVNDAGYTPKVGEGSTFGLERLIRKVLMHSAAGHPPPIILIESYPYLYPESNRRNYADLSRHYSLLHWSYRGVIDGLAAAGSASSAPFDEHLRLHHLTFQDIHPSWHLHLFFAELVAGNVRRAVQSCLSSAPPPACPPRPAPFVRFATPEPFHNLPKDAQCSRTVRPLLSIDAVDVAAGAVSAARCVGSVRAAAGWALVEDRPRKFGWVVDADLLGASSSYSAVAAADTAGGGSSHNVTLVFAPHLGAASALAALPDRARLILRVAFLATYSNAGIADVSFCGVPLSGGYGFNQGSIDALWPAFKTYHVSSPEMYEQEITWHAAGAGPGTDPGWSREEDDHKLHVCVGDDRTLAVAYRPRPASDFADPVERFARQKQKVRIIGAKVCISEHGP